MAIIVQTARGRCGRATNALPNGRGLNGSGAGPGEGARSAVVCARSLQCARDRAQAEPVQTRRCGEGWRIPTALSPCRSGRKWNKVITNETLPVFPFLFFRLNSHVKDGQTVVLHKTCWQRLRHTRTTTSAETRSCDNGATLCEWPTSVLPLCLCANIHGVGVGNAVKSEHTGHNFRFSGTSTTWPLHRAPIANNAHQSIWGQKRPL